eukprot:CAMPEP_0176210036 /NCGR_PEP_ID=MMETSP0121_2-20121125/13937_1 /TAXON_ID=160619 /ORGANISM="Kryptoperidinium foliaceum, Strain CCMP 1326" /LENGTH=241 /DNA_ID=CAMNT_0017549057 /DNA_START=50 /DNA_END=772 /DNA_ORIENTATION=-
MSTRVGDTEEVDFNPDTHGASDSDSSDGLPPLDPYWAAKLNVTNTAAPLPPPKMLSPEELAREKERERQAKARGRGKGGKGDGKGGKGKGWKGGGKRPGGVRPNDIGDFVAWARDPQAEDGSRRLDRSRSPRRQGRAEGLEGFMSWARDRDAEEEAPRPEGPDTALGEAASAESRSSRAPAPLRPKEEPEDAPDAAPQPEQELIVPKELEEELRAMGAVAEPRPRRGHDSDDESDREVGVG